MRKVISFGKIAYANRRRENEFTVDMELKMNKAGNYIFSAMGNVWNRMHTDILAGGQMLDLLITTPELKTNALAKEIHSLWEQYHLNDMKPYCEHQKGNPVFNKPYDEIDDDKLVCPICGYKYGSAWKTEIIPDDVVKRIKEIMENADEEK